MTQLEQSKTSPTSEKRSFSGTLSSPIGILECSDKINKQTLKKLCDLKWDIDHEPIRLKKIETFRKSLHESSAPPELSADEAQNRIIDPQHIHAWITAPGQKQYQLKIPRDLPINIPYTLNIWGRSIILNRLSENGYNSEFDILEWGKRWTIVGTIFTNQHPKYTILEKMITSVKKQIWENITLEKTIKQELVQLDKIMHSTWAKWKKGTSHKKNLSQIHDKKVILEEGLSTILNQRVWLEISRVGYMKELDTTRKYMSFPYMPYQSHLNTPEIRTAGMRYIGKIMNDAYDELRSQKYTNITGTLPNGTVQTIQKNISEIDKQVPPEVVLLLNIIERMDYKIYSELIPAHLESRIVPLWGKKKWTKTIQISVPAKLIFKSPETIDTIMKEQVGRALTTFGLNWEDAFRWQRNRDTDALWIAQFIPSTYSEFQKKYSVLSPEAWIPSSHEIGAKDHKTSLKFQIMHLYDEYDSLPKWMRNNWGTIIQDPQAKIWAYSILAAGYNGKMRNVLSEAWINTPGDHTISELYPERLKERFAHNQERLTYVMKLEYLLKIYFTPSK